MKKQEVLSILDRLPDPFDPADLMDEVYLKAQIDRAEAAIARGDLVSQEDVVRWSQEWFELDGRNRR